LVQNSEAGRRAGLVLIVFGRAILTKSEREADLVAQQILVNVQDLERES